MAKRHDAALKQLIDGWSPQWTPLLCEHVGLPPTLRAEPLDADLSVASNQADELFRLDGGRAGLLHLELESSWSGGPALDDLFLYNVLAHHRYGGPVYSVLMLLRREAWSPEITGVLRRTGAGGRFLTEFHYTPVRVWELPSEPLLRGPIGTLPLVMLTDEAQVDLRQTIARIDQRLQQDAPTQAVGDSLWTTCTLLLGMRMDREQALRLFQGARVMRDSSVYQGILEEGRGEGELAALRRILRRQGERRFGVPRPEDEAALASIADVGRLDRMADRILSATSWADLLNTP
jgi:hypothetical protein